MLFLLVEYWLSFKRCYSLLYFFFSLQFNLIRKPSEFSYNLIVCFLQFVLINMIEFVCWNRHLNYKVEDILLCYPYQIYPQDNLCMNRKKLFSFVWCFHPDERGWVLWKKQLISFPFTLSEVGAWWV